MASTAKKITVSRKKLGRVNKYAALFYAELESYRPKRRSECGIERPCPFVGCKYHLFLDVSDSGSIIFNHPDKEVWDMETSCVLDVVEQSCTGLTLEQVGDVFNLTRERIRQIEGASLQVLRREIRDDFLLE